jgi:hypothetical protein
MRQRGGQICVRSTSSGTPFSWSVDPGFTDSELRYDFGEIEFWIGDESFCCNFDYLPVTDV